MKIKNELPKKGLINGIPIDVSVSKVKSELVSLGYEVHRVSMLNNFKSKICFGAYFQKGELQNIFDVRNFLRFSFVMNPINSRDQRNGITAGCIITDRNFFY